MSMYSFQALRENLDINPATLRNWCKRFKIPSEKIGNTVQYSDKSLNLLLKIKTLRTKNYSYEEISNHLAEKKSPYQELLKAIQRLDSGHQISIFDVLPELV